VPTVAPMYDTTIHNGVMQSEERKEAMLIDLWLTCVLTWDSFRFYYILLAIVGMSSCICAIVPGIALLLGSKTPGFLAWLVFHMLSMFSTLKGFGTRVERCESVIENRQWLVGFEHPNHRQLMLPLSKHLFCSDHCYHTYQKYETQN